MARRPESRARGDVRDVRAFEERLCLPRPAIGRLVAHLLGVIAAVPREAAVLAETAVWLRLRDAYAVVVLLLTGLRRFEFCGLTCGDLNLEEGKLSTIGKGKNRDFVPLPDEASRLLAEWLAWKRLRGESVAADAPLFCATGSGDGGFLSFGAFRLRWKQILVEAGLSADYGIHATRHAAGLLVFARTGSIEKTARFLRHRDTRTTARHYLHVDADELRRELSGLDLWRAP